MTEKAEDVQSLTPDTPQPIGFKAEIRQLLDILIHSLYTEREIFLRELISNASDALNQIRTILLTEHNVLDASEELAIKITMDEKEKILTISDTGVGMTYAELDENLGTIAYSGAKSFINAMQTLNNHKEETSNSDIIGQFGVGFYSVFMVAEWVRVTSRSYKPDEKAASWFASGEDTYTLSYAEREHRGTTIQIKIKEDAEEFIQPYRIKSVIKKHSDYVAFPIYLGEEKEQINRVTALWRQNPREVQPADYEEFYKQLTLDIENPLLHLHVNTDAPVQIYALLFVPSKADKLIFSLRKEEGLKLFARKVLIQDYCKDLLPEYFRFMQGVVDSEDLPLNVSRENIQSNLLIGKLKKVLSGKLVSAIKEFSIKNPTEYIQFWQEFGKFIKEGVASNQDAQERESLYPFLRFKSNKFIDNWISLNDYISRMKGEQKSIYYLLGDDIDTLKYSPHLEYFNKNGLEVLFFNEPIDAFMIMGLNTYEGFTLDNCASCKIPDSGKESEAPQKSEQEKENNNSLLQHFKEQLKDKVVDVRASERLIDSVARLIDAEGSMGQEWQRVYRYMGKEFEQPKKVLEINIQHPIIKNLENKEISNEVNKTIIDLVYENALLMEGLHPNPSKIIPLIQKVMLAALHE